MSIRMTTPTTTTPTTKNGIGSDNDPKKRTYPYNSDYYHNHNHNHNHNEDKQDVTYDDVHHHHHHQKQKQKFLQSSVQHHHHQQHSQPQHLPLIVQPMNEPKAKRVLRLEEEEDNQYDHKFNDNDDKKQQVQQHQQQDETHLPLYGVGKKRNDEKYDTEESKTETNRNGKNSNTTGGSSSSSTATTYQIRSIPTLYRDRNRRTNDEIHSSINLGSIITCIIDTPPMQRLRSLKQLGCAEYVYMNVNHNRFEHSLGVAHLSNVLCRKIAHQQPSLQTTEKDITCITLAGLLHDIGHGPFSHSYEQFVLHDFPNYYNTNRTVQDIYRRNEQQQSEQKGGQPTNKCWPKLSPYWTHECASLMMIDLILAYLGLAINIEKLDEPLQQIGHGIDPLSMRATGTAVAAVGKAGSTTTKDDDENVTNQDASMILTSRDWIFIKECIYGKPLPEIELRYGPGYQGRKHIYQDWLYDIVSNRHSGLDVDKIDYYARDQRRALRSSGEIDKVMIEEAIVAWAPCTNPTSCPRCRYNRHCNDPNNNDQDGAIIKKRKHTKNGKMISKQPESIVSTDEQPQHLMICYPDKMVGASMNFFKTRFELHSIIYKHKTNVGVAYMISDIMCLADPYFLISTAPVIHTTTDTPTNDDNDNNKQQLLGLPIVGYKSLPLSRAMLHPMSYLRLRDSVIDQIEATTCPELEPARKLIHRLWSRDLYKCAITKVLKIHKIEKERRIWELPTAGIVKDIVDFKAQHDDPNNKHTILQLTEQDIIVDKCAIHHGQKNNDPLSKMRFVDKNQLNKVATTNYYNLPQAKIRSNDEYESYLPRTLMECSLRIYCRNNAKIDLIRHAFELWWESMNQEMELTEEPTDNGNNSNKRRRGNTTNDSVAVLSQDTDYDNEYDDDDDDDEQMEKNDTYENDTTTFGVVAARGRPPHVGHYPFGDDDSSYPPWCSPI